MTRQVNTGTRESFSHPRAPVYRGGRERRREEEEEEEGGSFAGEREIGHEDSIRSGGDPASGRRSLWTGFKVNSKVLGPLPPPSNEIAPRYERHRALVPTDEETSDKRRGTVGNREMGRTDPWNGSWGNVFDHRPSNRSNFVPIRPSPPPPPPSREIRSLRRFRHFAST